MFHSLSAAPSKNQTVANTILQLQMKMFNLISIDRWSFEVMIFLYIMFYVTSKENIKEENLKFFFPDQIIFPHSFQVFWSGLLKEIRCQLWTQWPSRASGLSQNPKESVFKFYPILQIKQEMKCQTIFFFNNEKASRMSNY